MYDVEQSAAAHISSYCTLIPASGSGGSKRYQYRVVLWLVHTFCRTIEGLWVARDLPAGRCTFRLRDCQYAISQQRSTYFHLLFLDHSSDNKHPGCGPAPAGNVQQIAQLEVLKANFSFSTVTAQLSSLKLLYTVTALLACTKLADPRPKLVNKSSELMDEVSNHKTLRLPLQHTWIGAPSELPCSKRPSAWPQHIGLDSAHNYSVQQRADTGLIVGEVELKSLGAYQLWTGALGWSCG